MSKKEKEHSRFQWFFFVIFIPTLFAIILVGIVLSFLGVNVIDHAKQFGSKVPFVSNLFVEKEEPDVDELLKIINENNEKLEKLEVELQEKEDEISSLQKEISVKEQEAEREKMNEVQTDRESTSKNELKDVAKTYESMSAKNAASILSELEATEALVHISQVSIDKRAAIMAKMEPERAAELMKLLIDKENMQAKQEDEGR